ncbi:MAG: sigma-70 family RNA polymerase sigma factor [Acidobacteria bacterium]|nr:sigma-70 family RNA polymerase sigma factor [Acidobacteriota bacterium]
MEQTARDKDIAESLQRLASSRADQQAWELLYKHLWPFVVSLAYRALRGQRDLAEDASQEVFYRLLRYCQFEKLQDPNAFRAYLATICRNVVRDYIAHLLGKEGLDPKTPIKEANSPGNAAEQNAQASELLDNLYQNIDNKSLDLLKLLMHGYSIAEISEQLGISYSNAAVRIHRLRLALRNQLKIHGF